MFHLAEYCPSPSILLQVIFIVAEYFSIIWIYFNLFTYFPINGQLHGFYFLLLWIKLL